MSNWLYKGEEILTLEQFPENCVGFVYKIYHTETNKMYIGKKILQNNLTKKLTIKEKEAWSKPGRIPTKKKEKKESNWSSYYGSSKSLLEDLKIIDKDKFTREIIELCFSKKQLSYYEVYYQMIYKVLAIDSYNDNILGKFYRKDVIQPIDNQSVITS